MSLNKSTFNCATLKAVSCVPANSLPKFPSSARNVFLSLKTFSPSALNLPSVGSISFSIWKEIFRPSLISNLPLTPNLEALFLKSVSISPFEEIGLALSLILGQ